MYISKRTVCLWDSSLRKRVYLTNFHLFLLLFRNLRGLAKTFENRKCYLTNICSRSIYQIYFICFERCITVSIEWGKHIFRDLSLIEGDHFSLQEAILNKHSPKKDWIDVFIANIDIRKDTENFHFRLRVITWINWKQLV